MFQFFWVPLKYEHISSRFSYLSALLCSRPVSFSPFTYPHRIRVRAINLRIIHLQNGKRGLNLSCAIKSKDSQNISIPRPLQRALVGLTVPRLLPSACPHVQHACATNDAYAPADSLLILPPPLLSLSPAPLLPGSPSVLIEVNARCSASASASSSSLLVRG